MKMHNGAKKLYKAHKMWLAAGLAAATLFGVQALGQGTAVQAAAVTTTAAVDPTADLQAGLDAGKADAEAGLPEKDLSNDKTVSASYVRGYMLGYETTAGSSSADQPAETDPTSADTTPTDTTPAETTTPSATDTTSLEAGAAAGEADAKAGKPALTFTTSDAYGQDFENGYKTAYEMISSNVNGSAETTDPATTTTPTETTDPAETATPTTTTDPAETTSPVDTTTPTDTPTPTTTDKTSAEAGQADGIADKNAGKAEKTFTDGDGYSVAYKQAYMFGYEFTKGPESTETETGTDTDTDTTTDTTPTDADTTSEEAGIAAGQADAAAGKDAKTFTTSDEYSAVYEAGYKFGFTFAGGHEAADADAGNTDDGSATGAMTGSDTTEPTTVASDEPAVPAYTGDPATKIKGHTFAEWAAQLLSFEKDIATMHNTMSIDLTQSQIDSIAAILNQFVSGATTSTGTTTTTKPTTDTSKPTTGNTTTKPAAVADATIQALVDTYNRYKDDTFGPQAAQSREAAAKLKELGYNVDGTKLDGTTSAATGTTTTTTKPSDNATKPTTTTTTKPTAVSDATIQGLVDTYNRYKNDTFGPQAAQSRAAAAKLKELGYNVDGSKIDGTTTTTTTTTTKPATDTSATKPATTTAADPAYVQKLVASYKQFKGTMFGDAMAAEYAAKLAALGLDVDGTPLD
ncbi:hypothetical protein [Lacticaseibacillus suihuaensis]